MKPKQPIILMAVILFLNVAVPGGAEEQKAVSWITEKEAALPAMKPPGISTKGIPESENQPFQVKKQAMAGPIIIIEKPDEDQFYDDLIDILISFDRNPTGEPVNMESLRIIYLKMFGIDITDRIRPYIKETRIDANGVKFPEGEHEFEIRIKDYEQMESSEIFKIKVN
ncbi:MAG: hypothetical protein HOA71_09085 [Nitrospina sp.]|jgi:hypothetical protein|nr:hypothetical protein [Nitrospina sp.]